MSILRDDNYKNTYRKNKDDWAGRDGGVTKSMALGQCRRNEAEQSGDRHPVKPVR